MLSYEEVRKRCLKPNLAEKPLYARVVTYFFSTRLVWLLAPLHFVTPDRVTILSLAAGLAGAYCTLDPTPANLLAAAFWLEFYFILDCVDGQLSRLRQCQTKTGAFLDTLVTYLAQSAFLAALGHGLAADHGTETLFLVGLAAAFASLWISLIWHFRASIFVYHFLRSDRVTIRRDPTAAQVKTSKRSLPGTVFSAVQKSLTLPYSMNLFTALALVGFAAQLSGHAEWAPKLAEVYLVYTAVASVFVAFALTVRWIRLRKVDKDFDTLFSLSSDR